MECHKDFEGSSRWTAASERFCNITHTSTSTNIWPGPTLYVVFNMASCCDTCFCWSCGVFQWWQQNFEHPIGFCWALHWSCWWRLGIPWVTVVSWGAPGPLIVIIQGQARLEMFGQSQQLTKNPHPAGFGWTWGKKCRGLLHPLEEHQTC